MQVLVNAKKARHWLRADLGRLLLRRFDVMLTPRFLLPKEAAQNRAMRLEVYEVSDLDCRKLYGVQ